MEASDAADGTETVLVAEDNEAVRTLVCAVLRRRGYAVLEAADGARAIEIARDHPGRVDLLLTDLVMPGRSGRELADELNRLRPGLKVLYVSGYTEDNKVRQQARESGGDFLDKPFARPQLLRKVRDVLDQRRGAEIPARPGIETPPRPGRYGARRRLSYCADSGPATWRPKGGSAAPADVRPLRKLHLAVGAVPPPRYSRRDAVEVARGVAAQLQVRPRLRK
ncbi:hypothetical protein BH20CHL6_BH20CHL6_08330 [soil metagenome]